MNRRLAMSIAAVLLVSGANSALAAAKDCPLDGVGNHPTMNAEDYRIEIVEQRPVGPGRTALDIAILRVRDATPMTEATVVRSAASMRSVDQSRTVARVTHVDSGRFGIYRFEIDTGAGGAGVLEFSATVPVASPIDRTFIPTARYTSLHILPGNVVLVSGAVVFCAR